MTIDDSQISGVADANLSKPKAVIRLVIADDHTLVREGFSYLLSAEPDFEVVGKAADGFEVLELAQKLQPQVVLMDLQMPGMNGVEAIRQLCQKHPQIKTIILTTFDTDEYIFEGVRAGAKGYLLKDAPKEELYKAIRLVNEGQSLTQPAITARLFALIAQSNPDKSNQKNEVLTERELEVIRLVAQGDRNKEIANKLSVSESTIKGYLSVIFQKFNVTDRTQAALYAMQRGILGASK